MVQSSVHLVMAVLLAGLAVATARLWSRSGRTYTAIVFATVAALAYDNAVLGLGRWVGHGMALQALSLPRYWLHAFTTPLLIIAAFGAARALGARWAGSRSLHGAVCLAATVLVGWGVVTDVAHLHLRPESSGGVVSYGHALASVPVPAVATIVALVVLGGLLWRAADWPWLAAGAAVMAGAAGLGGVSPLLRSLGELALAGSLYATERLAARRHEPRAAPVIAVPGGRVAGPRRLIPAAPQGSTTTTLFASPSPGSDAQPSSP